MPNPVDAGSADARARAAEGGADADARSRRAAEAGGDAVADASRDRSAADGEGGNSVCDGATCPNGCCTAAGTCAPSSNASCGLGGVACVACTADQECSAQGQCVCNASL